MLGLFLMFGMSGMLGMLGMFRMHGMFGMFEMFGIFGMLGMLVLCNCFFMMSIISSFDFIMSRLEKLYDCILQVVDIMNIRHHNRNLSNSYFNLN